MAGVNREAGQRALERTVLAWRVVPSRVSITPDLDFPSANVTQVVGARLADRSFLRFDEAVRTAR